MVPDAEVNRLELGRSAYAWLASEDVLGTKALLGGSVQSAKDLALRFRAVEHRRGA